MGEITWRPMAIGNYMYSKEENKFVRIFPSNKSGIDDSTKKELLRVIDSPSVMPDDFRDNLFFKSKGAT